MADGPEHRCLQRGSFPASSECWLPLPPSVTVEPLTTALAPVGAAAVASRTARAGAASNISVISGLTATTSGSTARERTTNSASAGTYVLNAANDAEFRSFQLRPGMRQLLQANPPPRNDNNEEFCVSWWGRGGCYSNCNRSATHRPFANAAERTRLMAHVRTHLTHTTPAAPAAGT